MAKPLTIVEAAAAMRAGALSPVDLLERCLATIGRLEPKLHAWVVVDRDGARKAAKESAARFAAGAPLSKLDGIPVGVKDLFYMTGTRTRAGSKILRMLYEAAEESPLDGPPSHDAGRITAEDQDAPVVAKLRAAGAVLVGKTVTTEFACFDPPPTRNPWNLNRTPGGSSSGSAAAVTTGMCLAALASQTGGSITRPASFCGICGIKPTYGRVSVRGAIPVAFSLDHVGAVAGSVADLGIMLSVIAGHDPLEPLSEDRPVPRGLHAIAVPGAPPNLKLATGPLVSEADAEVAAGFNRAAAKLRAAGATMKNAGVTPLNLSRIVALHRRIMAAELAEHHRTQYAKRKSDYGPKVASLIEEGLALSAADYAEAKREQLLMSHWLSADFAGNLFPDAKFQPAINFEILLTPATVTPAPGLETTGDPKFNSPWSFVGYPTVNIPCGLSSDGLPLGLQLVGRPWEEDKLLAAAAWCEKVIAFDAAPAIVGE